MKVESRRACALITASALAVSPALALAQGTEVMRTADGHWASTARPQHFCDQQNRCHDIVVDTVTHKVILADGNLAIGFQATGNGQEIVRLTTSGSGGSGSQN
jgi:hypothetical protein